MSEDQRDLLYTTWLAAVERSRGWIGQKPVHFGDT
jgi:hypothetical protein